MVHDFNFLLKLKNSLKKIKISINESKKQNCSGNKRRVLDFSERNNIK